MTISLKNLSKEDLKIYSNSRLFEIYKNLDQESLKCISYFQAYEEMFSKFVGKEIVFVEIGFYMVALYLCGKNILEAKQK